MRHALLLALKDSFSPYVLGFIVKITLLSGMLTGVVLWLTGGLIKSYVQSYLGMLPWEWLQSFGAGAAVVAIGYMLFILILSVSASLMIEPVLKRLAKKHYGITPVGSPSLSRSLLISLKTGAVFFLLFLFTFPLMFVPVLGAVYMLYLWSVPIKEPSVYDVSAMFRTPPPPAKRATLMAMAAAAFNYIPLLNAFTPVFAEIVFMHDALSAKKSSSD
jgi:hypothetical protein